MSESGGTASLNDLIRNHIPVAMRLAVRLTGSVHDAEDIVQEALLRAAKAFDSFRHEASFQTWLTRIIINVFRTRIAAAELKVEKLEETYCASNEPSAESIVETKETHVIIAELISRLPPRQRETMILLTWENYSPQEVSDLLEISIQNVYSHLSAARTFLKQRLAHVAGFDSETGSPRP